MRAVIFQPPFIGLQDVPEPRLPASDWLRVRVVAAGICGSDLSKILHLDYSPGYLQTRILGHEICGVVDECDIADEEIRDGDLVAVEPLFPCGRCELCQIGCTQLCRSMRALGRNMDGGFAEHVCVHRSQVHRLAQGTDPLDAVLADPLACVLHAFRAVEPAPKRSIAVIGDGAMGLLCCAVARWAGFRDITLIAKHSHSRDIAFEFGATHCWMWDGLDCSSLENRSDVVMEAVGGKQSETLRVGIAMARPGGMLAILGVYAPGFEALLPARDAFAKELRLVGLNSYSSIEATGDFAGALSLIQQRIVRPQRLVTHVLPLGQFGTALQILRDRRNSQAIKVVLASQ